MTINVTSVNDAPAVINNLATQTVQYSDSITAVTITATDVDSFGESLVASTSYTKNSGSSQIGLPAGLAMTLTSTTHGGPFPGGAAGSRTWTVSGNITAAPGTYLITVTVIDGSGGTSSTSFRIVVIKEDARATYSGAYLVSTPSATSGTAIVTLRATIQDITAVTGDPAYDAYAGDIRNATVTFVNRDAGNAPINSTPIPVTLLDSDTKVGTAAYDWTVNIGSNASQDFAIGIIVNNYYTRDASADDTVITVSKPLADFITGGGYLVLTNSSGKYAGQSGTKMNFGFNVKFNKSKTNLQGHVNIIIRSADSHVYQIKTTATDSLVANIITGVAQFTSKCNIADITNPLSTIGVASGVSLQISMTDRGEPGKDDTFAVTVWDKSNKLLFSSSWIGGKTVEQILGGGNLQVH
jgi:hypothetical protein